MLFAELHRKLSLDADDNERREDILTSTVFGTLIVGEKWSLLRAWLAAARDRNGDRLELPAVSQARYCFWPRLAEAEPDLLLLFGDILVIVEAKYRSPKSSHATSDQTKVDPADQLAREWRSCDATSCTGYAFELRETILSGAAKRVLVYLVSQPTSAKTRREIEASRAAIGNEAALYCLGWSDLAAILRQQRATSMGDWQGALAELLERRGFTAFAGFPSVNVASAELLEIAGMWRLGGVHSRKRTVSFSRALVKVSVDCIRPLSTSAERLARRRAGWPTILQAEKLALVGSLARSAAVKLGKGECQ